MDLRRVVGWGIVGFWLAVCGQALAVDHSFGGYAFGDYYYVASGPDKKQNGFQFRRIYLTWDMKWNDAFSGRVRLEANDGGFGSGKKMEPFVKHAYLRYRKNGRALYMGLSGTPTWSVPEKIWGYRSVEKTIIDLNKVGSSSDIGVAYEGRLDREGKVNVHLMLGNGSSTGAEGDNNKKVYGRIHFKPGGLDLTAYADFENRAGDQDRITLSGLVGRSGGQVQGAVEGFVQFRKHPTGDVQVRGLSVFGSGPVGEQVKAFGRVDLFDPSDRGGDDREVLVIGGLDVTVAKDIHVMPNVLLTAFQAPGVETQVIPRVTLFFEF